MSRIISSALRSFRSNGHRALQSRLQSQTSRTAATYTSPTKPTITAKPTQTPYKRSAATYSTPYKPAASSSSNSSSTNSTSSSSSSTPKSSYSYAPKPTTTTSSSSSSSSAPKPSYSSTAAKPPTPAPAAPTTAYAAAPTTAYAAAQMDPVQYAPYSPPPNAPPLPGPPQTTNGHGNNIDWASSFHGLSTLPFSPEVAKVLMAPIAFDDVEIKPDGIIYLPEIKYRRILNMAFGPGGWGMAPRGDLTVGEKVVTREYALLVHGRFIAQARGECGFFGGDDGIATAGEGCKSNALMRCCKDLGIASELWDPRYIRDYKKKYAQEIWVEHVTTKKKRIITLRKGDEPPYPYKKS